MRLRARGSELDLSFPHIMGILNMTPDSFSDGGRHKTLVDAITHANEMVIAGATILDIGGESTRPGADDVSVEDELARVIPVVEALSQRFEVWISVDTSKPEVIRAAAAAGAHLINDIRSLNEPGAREAAADVDLPVCLMHMQGEPKSMQHSPSYQQIITEVDSFLATEIERCIAAGIRRENILIDPGFGFGKNLQHNYELLANLSHFHHFDLPLLVGMSRKSMIGQLLNVGPTQRLSGSLACAVIAAIQGAQIIRVHDVKESVEAIRVVEATLRAKG
ncbi:dihydropteroate synthase [Rosenbergiella epipactidis]|uniref:dihydropteroate synthase n=1 Tax=Rosenbergiella epipactidis TaxID=1544694 RepID=UPI0006646AE0|nr:dihydropteroate synthase [Rosenbergiella epipactidis]KMV74100.1 dihydropteroate synthase [bacteria symbiont BFo2 of Frankliniella occidentalis]KYP95898.1 dihydropteroate synthase [bacteria symbiont BFo2 of Frankliniella occidentalis]